MSLLFCEYAKNEVRVTKTDPYVGCLRKKILFTPIVYTVLSLPDLIA